METRKTFDVDGGSILAFPANEKFAAYKWIRASRDGMSFKAARANFEYHAETWHDPDLGEVYHLPCREEEYRGELRYCSRCGGVVANNQCDQCGNG